MFAAPSLFSLPLVVSLSLSQHCCEASTTTPPPPPPPLSPSGLGLFNIPKKVCVTYITVVTLLDSSFLFFFM